MLMPTNVNNQVIITDPATGETSTWTSVNVYKSVTDALRTLKKLQQGQPCNSVKAVARVSKFLNTPLESLQICLAQNYNFKFADSLPKDKLELIIKKRQLTQEIRSLSQTA